MAALGRAARALLPAGLVGGIAYYSTSSTLSSQSKIDAQKGTFFNQLDKLVFSLARQLYEAERVKISISVCDE